MNNRGSQIRWVRLGLLLISLIGAGVSLPQNANAAAGTVIFNNRLLPGEAPVFDVDGVTRLSGPSYLAQLYAGPTATSLSPVGVPVAFRTGTGAGFVVTPGAVSIPSVTAGAVAHIQLRAWFATAGPTYEAAAANNGKTGASPTFTVTTGGGGDPPAVPPNLVGLRSFSLTLTKPPQITGHPQPVSILVGETAAFSVTATTSGAVTYQWRRNGSDLQGQTASQLRLTGVTLANAGTYTVVVKDSGGTVESRAALLTVALRPFVERRLPGGYAPSVKVLVTLQAAPPNGTASYGVEEQYPTGWRIGTISEEGSFDSVNQKVVWLFLDGTPRTLTYEIIPPAGATGTHRFRGIASADGGESAIGGQETLAPGLLHPADNSPSDNRIILSEFTGYAAAYKKGTRWAIEPNPIPIGYVTRAAALYRGGGAYIFDSKIATAPGWWVNPPSPAGTLAHFGKTSLTIANTAVRELPESYIPTEPVPVKIQVTPLPGVFSYAVEEEVPDRWVASDMSDGGEWDETNRKVKWVFLDGNPRTLTYNVTPAGHAKGNRKFNGIASFDGSDIEVSGESQLSPGARIHPPKRSADGTVQLQLRGEVGALYRIEVTENLRDWILLQTISDENGLINIADTAAALANNRFYRVRKVE